MLAKAVSVAERTQVQGADGSGRVTSSHSRLSQRGWAAFSAGARVSVALRGNRAGHCALSLDEGVREPDEFGSSARSAALRPVHSAVGVILGGDSCVPV